MRAVIAARARRLLDGFWFVPALIALLTSALAFPLVAADRALGIEGAVFAFGGGAGAARDVLSVVTGSVITVAGLTFSLTVVTLQLVSGQFSPRAAPSFLADRFNQVVAGFLLGIFGYGLLVMRTIRTGGEAQGDTVFVPGVAVAFGILLGLVALGVLIAFIHHLAQSISVPGILTRLSAATMAAIDRVAPADRIVTGEVPPRLPEADVVRAPRHGVVERIDLGALADGLERGSAVVLVRPGAHVTAGTALAQVSEPAAEQAVRRALVLADERAVSHDVDFGLRQLADIGLRALSPGINDPTTATSAIYHLAAALERLAERELPGWEQERRGDAAAWAPAPGFSDLMHTAFDELARVASVEVAVRLLEVLAGIARTAVRAGRPERVPVVLDLGEHVTESVEPGTRLDRERLAIAAEGLAMAARG